MARQNTMAEAGDEANPLTSWPGRKREKKKETRIPQCPSRKGPPVT
jgi:hypothetical protein